MHKQLLGQFDNYLIKGSSVFLHTMKEKEEKQLTHYDFA